MVPLSFYSQRMLINWWHLLQTISSTQVRKVTNRYVIKPIFIFFIKFIETEMLVDLLEVSDQLKTNKTSSNFF